MKKYIPNIITTYRLIIALLIPILFFYSSFNVVSILFITAILSDLIDGFLARRWNVVSTYGKVADAIGDKLLALSTSSTFIVAINKNFTISLMLELLILAINGIYYIESGNFKNNTFDNQASSIYGKIKTWFLFFSLFIGLISLKFEILNILILPSILITAVMQLITATNYIKSYKTLKQ